MDEVNYLRFIVAFVFVLGLIGVCGMLLKRFAARGMGPQSGGRLAVIETRYLDPRRRLVLIRRDDKEHLLLLADGRELVIESIKSDRTVSDGQQGNA